MRTPITPFVIAASLLSAPAWAQSTLPLSMKRAVEIALAPDGNTRVALAKETVEQAQQKVEQARAAFLPSLDASVSDRRQTTNLRLFGLDMAFPISIPGFTFPTVVGPFTVFDARATVQQSVLNFADLKRFQASKAGAAAATSDNDTTKNSVSDEIARRYLASLRAESVRDTARANVELSEALLQLAQRQRSAGTGTGIEVTRAEVQLANDRQRLIQAEDDRMRTVLDLLKAMGLPLDSPPVEFTDKLEFTPVETASATSMIDQARKMRPELKTQLHREDSAKLSYKAIKSEHLPSIGASADFGTLGPAIVGSHGTYTLGVSLRIPVYDGGRREARSQESFSQFKQEQIRTRDISQLIELQVRQALESLKSATASVDAAQNGQTLAESELAQARRRYEAGVTNSVEVTDAQTRLVRARYNLVSALFDYNVARLDLATATGTIAEYVNK